MLILTISLLGIKSEMSCDFLRSTFGQGFSSEQLPVTRFYRFGEINDLNRLLDILLQQRTPRIIAIGKMKKIMSRAKKKKRLQRETASIRENTFIN